MVKVENDRNVGESKMKIEIEAKVKVKVASERGDEQGVKGKGKGG